MLRISKFYRRDKNCFDQFLSQLRRSNFNMPLNMMKRFYSYWIHLLNILIYCVNCQQNNEIRNTTVIRFAKGVQNTSPSHSLMAPNEEGTTLLQNRVNAIVTWFQMEEGCTSLLQNKQFQPKSTAKSSIVRDAHHSRISFHAWYLNTAPTSRNVHLFYSTPFHKSSNIL